MSANLIPLTSAGGFSTAGNVTGGNIVTAGTGGNLALTGGDIVGANVVSANLVQGALANSTGRFTLLSDNTLLSGTVASPQNFKVSDTYTPDVDLRNSSGTGMFTQGSSLTLRTAGTYNWNFSSTGNVSMPGNVSAVGNVTGNYFVGNGSALTSVATQVTGSWTLTTGTNTVSFTIPTSGTYSIWVNGNIPLGIATYTATIVLTNNNVPVLGSSYAWYYAGGNSLVWTSIPNQIVGTNNAISNAAPAVSNTNVFTFGIDNNSGSSQVVNYGWTKL